MLGSKEKKELARAFKPIQLIWLALLGSLIPYALVCLLVGAEMVEGLETQTLTMMIYLFAGLAATMLILAFLLRTLMLKSAPVAPRSTAKEDQGSVQLAVRRYRTAVIITLAVLEAIAIWGLVLVFLGAGLYVFFTFWGLSAVSMVYFRPRMDEFEAFAERLSRS